ncbi:MAG TPA: bifunctional oligoribonuclease/PAP phosphatase NrnA [Anaerolineales bacterium]|nr:bifunctional oligoribonuclease/PAP phosphatase NrnA [Anaerolineales bacterium]
MRSEFQKAGELIRAAQEIALISHERPDGDAVGSLLALTVSLQLDGKRVTPVLADGVPGRFRFLPAAQAVQTRLPDSWDLLICVDSGDLERLGFEPSAFGTPPDLNIDHHPTNTNFARVNIVDPVAAATAEILYDLILSLEMPLDVDVASNLLAGIVNDTIGFRTTNVTPKVLRTAADLLGRGAPLAHIYERSLSQRSFVAARYWGSGLSNLERDGGLVWASLSLQDRQRAGYPGPDDADLVDLLTTIDGAQIVAILVEQPGEKTKVSWRSREGLDVSGLAASFGGGGHKPAAGAMVEGSLEDVKARVLDATRRLLHDSMEAKA